MGGLAPPGRRGQGNSSQWVSRKDGEQEGEFMTGRFTRVLLVTTALTTLLVPAVGSIASPQEEQDDLAAELDEIRDRIDTREDQAASKKDLIDQLNVDITDLQIAINKLDQEITEVEGEVRDAQSRVDATKADIAKVQDMAVDQAVALYKGGTIETIDALLESEDLSELNDRVQMLGVAAEENTGALVKYGRLKVELQDEYEELFTLKTDLDAKLANREQFQTELADRRTVLKAELAKLNVKIEEDKALEEEKQEKYDDITAEILAAQAPVGTSVVPSGVAPNTGGPSASGFVWPLNGAVTSGYGYRWGRMHEGIDIDGYTGQPIVASKSGRVISAGDAGDGYGTKVVIDHGGGYSTLYGHMSSLGTSGGASVSQGQVIGYVGCTGSCTGDHLHFEVRVNGAPRDPLAYLP
jgi:murein DD-endopeptidase MepM/ murein hydrolase activator NlpD